MEITDSRFEDHSHLEYTTGWRGFDHMPEIPSTYGGFVRVYESSNAAGPHIWLKAEEVPVGDDRIPVTAFAHLTLNDAVKLAEQILYLADHHYQLDY